MDVCIALLKRPFLLILILTCLLSACYDPMESGGNSSARGVVTDQASGNDTGTDANGPIDQGGSGTGSNGQGEIGASPIIISLEWQPVPGQIDGYIVHTGATPELATSVQTVTSETKVEYDAILDLGLSPGDHVCFRLKAFNAGGESGFSDPICYLVHV